MQVIFFLHAPYYGGVEKNSLHLLTYLKNHIPLRVFCSLTSLTLDLKKRGVNASTIYMGRKIGGHRSFFFAMLSTPFFLLQYCLLLKSFLKERKNTIIAVQTLNEKFLLSPLAAMLGFKIVWIDHGPLSSWITGLPLQVYQYCSHFCQKIIAVSQTTKKDLLKIGVAPHKITVIPNGIPVKNVATKLPSQQITLGYLARLIPQKGAQVLLEALTQIPKQDLATIKVLIGGAGYYRKSLETFVSQQHLESIVSFIGWQEKEEKFYKQIDCFINPSLYNEGFGLTILEAWQYKLPVIASATGAFVELIENNKNGLLFEKKNIKELARKICYIIHHPEIAAKLGLAGYTTLRNHFTLEKMGQQYVQQLQYLAT